MVLLVSTDKPENVDDKQLENTPPLGKATPTTVAEQHNELPRNLTARPLPVNATFSGLIPLNKPINMP